MMGIGGDYRWHFGTAQSGSNDCDYATSEDPVSWGVWQHVAVTFDDARTSHAQVDAAVSSVEEWLAGHPPPGPS